jgi:hypothetical protein
MLCPCGIEAVQIFVAMEYVDQLLIEASFHQCLNGIVGVLRVGDCAHDTVRWVRNEAAFSWVSFHESIS